MGLCSSNATPEEAARMKAQKARDKQLAKQLAEDHIRDAMVHKLLFLGAGESGKSTLLKQMKALNGVGMSDEDRAGFVKIIHQNVWKAIGTLCEMSAELLEEDDLKGTTQVHPDAEDARQWVAERKSHDAVTPDDVQFIKLLWKDEGIQNTYRNRALFQLDDSAKYFLDDVDRLAEDDYLPTNQDVLRSRTRTTGIVEEMIEMNGTKFNLFDVGGQRNERKKWIHCFENVEAIMFVAALSAYDLVLFEDETVNRMDEAINLFEDTIRKKWFAKTHIILFLNKKDLFAEKIVEVPLTRWDPDYEGLNNETEGQEYIRDKFLAANRQRGRDIYCHFTNATDADNINHVFAAVRDIVIKSSLQDGGLL